MKNQTSLMACTALALGALLLSACGGGGGSNSPSGGGGGGATPTDTVTLANNLIRDDSSDTALPTELNGLAFSNDLDNSDTALPVELN